LWYGKQYLCLINGICFEIKLGLYKEGI
jgi:hypothetical protein